MKLRNCSGCIWQDRCHGRRVCDDFFPVDEDVRRELEDMDIMNRTARELDEYRICWREYVDDWD
jgi:hypothetical protein